MDIVAVGLSHKTAPVEIRERFAVRPDRLPSFLPALKAAAHLREAVVLSTCNRFEVYGVIPKPNGTIPRLLHFLSQTFSVQPVVVAASCDSALLRNAPQPHSVADAGEMRRLSRATQQRTDAETVCTRDAATQERGNDRCARLYQWSAPESVGHLYRVAAGLDSMVLGENEILGQVKQAYGAAKGCGATGKYLNRLFEAAINAAKAVRTETGIGRGALSVGSVAISLADRIFSRGLHGRSVMLVGAGKVAELTLKHLQDAGASSVIVSSRRPERARELAEAYGGSWATLEAAWDQMQAVDIMLVSTAAPHYLVGPDRMRALMAQRHQRPLFLIDLAVPRNVDPAVGRLDNVYLYDIDDLERIIAANVVERCGELERCMTLVEYKVGLFMRWLGREVVCGNAECGINTVVGCFVASVGTVPEGDCPHRDDWGETAWMGEGRSG